MSETRGENRQNSMVCDEAAEQAYLKHVLALIDEQLESAIASGERTEAELVEARRDMFENIAFFEDDFERMTEAVQAMQNITGRLSAGKSQGDARVQLTRMRHSPYFARVDFLQDESDASEHIYIGRRGLMDKSALEMLVYDWRAPISSLFYRYEAGRAKYKAPVGDIHGEITLKRQYEIKNGQLEYFFDAGVQINDEFLRRALSKNSSPEMKAIVETIQKDQDEIIRDNKNQLLMVQGAAGSGKTSIALHRAAYLMYQGLSRRLNASNILVLSPNTLFARYIGGVLPDLGEENVMTEVFDDICAKILGDECNFQTRNKWLEDVIARGDSGNIRETHIKTSEEYLAAARAFSEEVAAKHIQFEDVYYAGQVVVTRQLARESVLHWQATNNVSKARKTLGFLLGRLERRILYQIHQLEPWRRKKLYNLAKTATDHSIDLSRYARYLSIRESISLAKKIRGFTRLSATLLYAKMWKDEKFLSALSGGFPEDDIHDIARRTLDSLNDDGSPLPYGDAVAMAFLKLELEGFTFEHDVRQLVIDEAQDYQPAHFAILSGCFPRARITALGDIAQAVQKSENMAFYDMIRRVTGVRSSLLLELKKSYRSTRQIIDFSSRLAQPGLDIEHIRRDGDEVSIIQCGGTAQAEEKLIDEIKRLKEKGYSSVAVITKTQAEASELHGRLGGRIKLRLIRMDGLTDARDEFLIPVYLSKGLEFDAVIVFGADDKSYNTQDDRQLLYIAATRALHSLTFISAENISRWLGVPGGN